MNKKLVQLITVIILFSPLLIRAETLEIELEVQGMEPFNKTSIYEGYEFNETVFTDYSIILLGLTKYHITQEYSSGFGEFTAKLTSSNGKELSQSKFQPSFYILSNPPTETDTDTIILNFDYSEQVKYLEVYHNNDQKLKINIKKLLCNKDSVCNENENYLSCPSDCPLYSQDELCSGYSGDNYCDTDCYTDTDCNQENCNDNIQNQDETSIDQGGVCAEEDCTLKELNNEIVCGDSICSECEDEYSCHEDCYKPAEEDSKAPIKEWLSPRLSWKGVLSFIKDIFQRILK